MSQETIIALALMKGNHYLFIQNDKWIIITETLISEKQHPWDLSVTGAN